MGTERSKCFSSHKIFTYFTPSTPPRDLQQPLFFLRGATFGLTRMSFKLLALPNPIIGIFSKVFPCSLPGINNKCVSDSTCLSFEGTG